MSAPDDDLVTSEGVDEGSAASTVEGADSGAAATLGDPPAGPASESDPAPPVDIESGESQAARDAIGTGQQVQVGEG